MHAIAGPSRLGWTKVTATVAVSRNPYALLHTSSTKFSGRIQEGSEDTSAQRSEERKGAAAEHYTENGHIYSHSKAAGRPRANLRAPLYSTRRILPKERRSDVFGPPGKGDGPKDAQDSTALKNVSTSMMHKDQVLQRLHQRLKILSSSIDRDHSVEALQICADMKVRLSRIAKEKDTHLGLPRFVYTFLLRILAGNARLEVCQQVVKDMEKEGVLIDVGILNWVLKAAVMQGDESMILETLEKISLLPSHESRGEQLASANSSLIPLSWSRNWTTFTYQQLFLRSRLSHNLEYCLALLGSASQRDKTPLGAQDADSSFLTQTLDSNTMESIIATAVHAREARLAVDLGLWMDEIVGKRRLHTMAWMRVLRSCADLDWFPGVALAWERAVVRGLATVDEGLVLSVCLCASRAGEAAFIKEALKVWQERAPPMSTKALQEWHITPLLDAQSSTFDFESALQTASQLARLPGHTKDGNTLLLESLMQAASTSVTAFRSAFSAFLRVGRSQEGWGGVCVATLNALMMAANRLDLYDMTIALYKSRNYVRNEYSTASDTIAALPPDLESAYWERSMQEDETPTILMLDKDSEKQVASLHTVQANVQTYNILLSTAIDRRNRHLAKAVLTHLTKANIHGDATTYERVIVLSLTQPSYESAFTYLGECKENKITPTRDSYLAIGKRCLEERDERWIGIGQEMLKRGYYPGPQLAQALQKGGWMETDSTDARRTRRSAPVGRVRRSHRHSVLGAQR